MGQSFCLWLSNNQNEIENDIKEDIKIIDEIANNISPDSVITKILDETNNIINEKTL
jgi:hypothetical protein